MPDTMPPAATATEPPAQDGTPRRAEIQGLVDTASATRIAGWARNAAAPGERLRIEFRIGSTLVAECTADQERRDLVKVGMGDGRHAFELPLTREWASQHAEMAVFACAADGTRVALPMHIRRVDVDPGGNLQRMLDTTAMLHRQILEEVRTVGRRAEALDTERSEVVARLSERVETLTIWMTRVDERLAAMAQQAQAAPPRRGLDPWQAVLGAILLLLLAAAAFGTAVLVRG
jgi:hypothetical protein